MYKVVRQIAKLILIAYKEKYLLLEINTMMKILQFRMKYVIVRGCLL